MKVKRERERVSACLNEKEREACKRERERDSVFVMITSMIEGSLNSV